MKPKNNKYWSIYSPPSRPCAPKKPEKEIYSEDTSKIVKEYSNVYDGVCFEFNKEELPDGKLRLRVEKRYGYEGDDGCVDLFIEQLISGDCVVNPDFEKQMKNYKKYLVEYKEDLKTWKEEKQQWEVWKKQEEEKQIQKELERAEKLLREHGKLR